jgi:hypothetical protein
MSLDHDKAEAICWEALKMGITSDLLLDGATDVEWFALASQAGQAPPTHEERDAIIEVMREHEAAK